MQKVAIVTIVRVYFCAFLCLLPGAASHAQAAQATVEGVSINLPEPAGFCELSGSHPADKRMLDTIGELVAKARGNQLLAMSADCRQLEAWRAGRRLLGDYGQYQAPQLASASEETFRQTCAALRTQGGQSIANMRKDLKDKMEDSVRRMKVNDQRFAGFLGEDPTACYVALVQKLKSEDGSNVTQLTVLAITTVKDKFLFVNRYAPYVNADTVNETLSKLKLTIAALLDANRS
jgi:hypothetical protein